MSHLVITGDVTIVRSSSEELAIELVEDIEADVRCTSVTRTKDIVEVTDIYDEPIAVEDYDEMNYYVAKLKQAFRQTLEDGNDEELELVDIKPILRLH